MNGAGVGGSVVEVAKVGVAVMMVEVDVMLKSKRDVDVVKSTVVVVDVVVEDVVVVDGGGGTVVLVVTVVVVVVVVVVAFV